MVTVTKICFISKCEKNCPDFAKSDVSCSDLNIKFSFAAVQNTVHKTKRSMDLDGLLDSSYIH